MVGDWNADVDKPARGLGASVCGDGKNSGLCAAGLAKWSAAAIESRELRPGLGISSLVVQGSCPWSGVGVIMEPRF